jgi:hypothetical protein
MSAFGSMFATPGNAIISAAKNSMISQYGIQDQKMCCTPTVETVQFSGVMQPAGVVALVAQCLSFGNCQLLRVVRVWSSQIDRRLASQLSLSAGSARRFVTSASAVS